MSALYPNRWVKPLIPILAIVVIAAVQSAEQRHGTIPACTGSGSCLGDPTQPLIELLQPAPTRHS